MKERIQQFLIFCSAADPELLRECPRTEQIKYQGIGATVLFTALLASVSGAYALFTVFKSYTLSILLGMLWGLIIFNLDRFIISSVKKSRSFTREVIQVIPRVLLAIFLAIVISKPLELRIFKQEIDEYLHFTGMEKLAEADSVYEAKKATERAQIDVLKAETAALFDLREQYYEEYKCECEGTCGTGEKGIGSECLRKEKKYLKTDQEYQDLKLRNDSLIAVHQAQILQLNTDLNAYRAELSAKFADGLMARLDALGKLPWLPSLFVMLLLFAIETAPILVKLLSPYGPYDNLLKVREYEYELREIESVNVLNQQLNSKITVAMGKEHIQIDAEMDQAKQAQHMINDAQLELMREELKIWIQEEKDRIRQSHQNKKVS